MREAENTEKMAPSRMPLAPRERAYMGSRGAMIPTPSITVKTAIRMGASSFTLRLCTDDGIAGLGSVGGLLCILPPETSEWGSVMQLNSGTPLYVNRLPNDRLPGGGERSKGEREKYGRLL